MNHFENEKSWKRNKMMEFEVRERESKNKKMRTTQRHDSKRSK